MFSITFEATNTNCKRRSLCPNWALCSFLADDLTDLSHHTSFVTRRQPASSFLIPLAQLF